MFIFWQYVETSKHLLLKYAEKYFWVYVFLSTIYIFPIFSNVLWEHWKWKVLEIILMHLSLYNLLSKPSLQATSFVISVFLSYKDFSINVKYFSNLVKVTYMMRVFLKVWKRMVSDYLKIIFHVKTYSTILLLL